MTAQYTAMYCDTRTAMWLVNCVSWAWLSEGSLESSKHEENVDTRSRLVLNKVIPATINLCRLMYETMSLQFIVNKIYHYFLAEFKTNKFIQCKHSFQRMRSVCAWAGPAVGRGRRDLQPLCAALWFATGRLISSSQISQDKYTVWVWQHSRNYTWQATIILQHVRSDIIFIFHVEDLFSSACIVPYPLDLLWILFLHSVNKNLFLSVFLSTFFFF